MDHKVLTLVIFIFSTTITCNPIWQKLDESRDEESLVSELNFGSESKNDLVLQFVTFGQKHSLVLEPANDIFADGFKISYLNSTIVDYDDVESLRGHFYTERDGLGSFYVETNDGHLQVDGIVDNLVRLRHENGQHKAIRISLDKFKDAFVDDVTNVRKHNEIIRPITVDEDKLPDVIVVEIFTVVDSELQKGLRNVKMPVEKYLGILWNYVQNEYKSMSKPRITFSITASTLLPETDWIKSTIIDHVPFGVPIADSHTLIDRFGEWLNSKLNDIDQPHYDVAVMHSGLDLASPIAQTKKFTPGNLGVAFSDGVCNFYKYKDIVASCGLMEDLAPSKFEGIIAVTHEVAHLFGASHDDMLPKELNCPKHYIMHSTVSDETINKFSDCSITSMRRQLSLPQSSCVWTQSGTTAIPMRKPDKLDGVVPE